MLQVLDPEKPQSLRVVFMGTPEFALPTLMSLAHSTHHIVAVYTQPPKPAGRGQKLTPSAVERAARALNLPVETPLNFKSETTISTLRHYQPDVIVVAAYGLLLPPAVLTLPPYGAINIHPSLLPRWRGAAPIHRPLLAGDAHTGMTIMQMAAGLDTGDMLLQQPMPITAQTTYLSLHTELAALGAEMLLTVLGRAMQGTQQVTPQDERQAIYAEKLQKREAFLDFSQDIQHIDRAIRALNPWPGTEFQYHGERVKILAATTLRVDHDHPPGTILDTQLSIACTGGILQPTLLKRPGKGAQPLAEFLRGVR